MTSWLPLLQSEDSLFNMASLGDHRTWHTPSALKYCSARNLNCSVFSLSCSRSSRLWGYLEVPHFFSVLSNCSNSSTTLGICKFWVGTGWEQKLISVFWLGSVLCGQVSPFSIPKTWKVVWSCYLRSPILGYDLTSFLLRSLRNTNQTSMSSTGFGL